MNFFVSLSTQVEKQKVTLRVTNSMAKLLFFRFWVTNSMLKNKISRRVTNLMMRALLFSHIRVTNVKLMSEKISEDITVWTWYGKTRVTSCDLRVESLKGRDKIQNHELKFKSTSYEFKSTSLNPRVACSNPRVQ